MKLCCGMQIPFTARTLPFGPGKGAFYRVQFVIWPCVGIIIFIFDLVICLSTLKTQNKVKTPASVHVLRNRKLTNAIS